MQNNIHVISTSSTIKSHELLPGFSETLMYVYMLAHIYKNIGTYSYSSKSPFEASRRLVRVKTVGSHSSIKCVKSSIRK